MCSYVKFQEFNTRTSSPRHPQVPLAEPEDEASFGANSPARGLSTPGRRVLQVPRSALIYYSRSTGTQIGRPRL